MRQWGRFNLLPLGQAHWTALCVDRDFTACSISQMRLNLRHIPTSTTKPGRYRMKTASVGLTLFYASFQYIRTTFAATDFLVTCPTSIRSITRFRISGVSSVMSPYSASGDCTLRRRMLLAKFRTCDST